MNPLESSSYEEEHSEIDNLNKAIEDSLATTVIEAAQNRSPEEARKVFKASLVINRIFNNVLFDARADGTSVSDLPTLQGMIDDYVAKLNFDSSILSNSVEKFHKLAVELAKEEM